VIGQEMAIQAQEIICFLSCKKLQPLYRGCDAALAFLSFRRGGCTAAVSLDSGCTTAAV